MSDDWMHWIIYSKPQRNWVNISLVTLLNKTETDKDAQNGCQIENTIQVTTQPSTLTKKYQPKPLLVHLLEML